MFLKLMKAGRPHFLVIGLVVYLFGAAWASLSGIPISYSRLALGALVVLLSQLSVSYSNEYFDRDVDQPGLATFFSGGSSVLANDPGLSGAVRRLALALMTGSILAGVVFIWAFSYPLWLMVFVLLGNLAGWYYSATPLRLSARGLGEIVYTLILGFLTPGLGYLSLRGGFDRHGFFILPPLVIYSLTSILSVELPDLEVDREGGKKTWVVSRGRRCIFNVIGGLCLAGTGYFFLIPRLAHGQLPVNFHSPGWLSLIPLSAGMAGLLIHPPDRKRATVISTWIIISLVLFVLLVDSFLIGMSFR